MEFPSDLYRAIPVSAVCKWYSTDNHTYIANSLHADDTSIFYHYKNVTKMENALSKELANVYGWFVDSKLSIHFGKNKTEYLFKLTS